MAIFRSPDDEWLRQLAQTAHANAVADNEHLICPVGCEQWVQSLKSAYAKGSVNPEKLLAMVQANFDPALLKKRVKKATLSPFIQSIPPDEFERLLKQKAGDAWFRSFKEFIAFSQTSADLGAMSARLHSWCSAEFALLERGKLGALKTAALQPYRGRYTFRLAGADSLFGFVSELASSNNPMLIKRHRGWIVHFNDFVSMSQVEDIQSPHFSAGFKRWADRNFQRLLCESGLAAWRRAALLQNDFLGFYRLHFKPYKREVAWLKSYRAKYGTCALKRGEFSGVYLARIGALVAKGKVEILKEMLRQAEIDEASGLRELLSTTSSAPSFRGVGMPKHFATDAYESMDRSNSLNERFRGLNGYRINAILRNLSSVTQLNSFEIEAMHWTTTFLRIKSTMDKFGLTLQDVPLEANEKSFLSKNAGHLTRGSMEAWRIDVLKEIDFARYCTERLHIAAPGSGDFLLKEFYLKHGNITGIASLGDAALIDWRRRLVRRAIRRGETTEANWQTSKAFRRLQLILPEISINEWRMFFTL